MTGTQINLDDFPDSAYAQQLRRSEWDLHFEGNLEAEYIVTHVKRARVRARVWFTTVLVLSSVFTTLRLIKAGVSDVESLINIFILWPCAAALAWLSWSRRFAGWFLPGASWLAPLSYIIVSVLIAHGLARGDDHFASYTVNVLGVFFFSGLMYRRAVATAVGMLLAFSIGGLLSHVPPPLLVPDIVVMLMSVALGCIVHRDVEKSYRVGFLESALIGELAARDGLTGLMNRRSFEDHLARIWQHAMRDRQSIAILLIDIDHFKEYNDGFGHQAGDHALRSVARAIQSSSRRPLDLAARFGGEEFVVIFYDLSLAHVREMADHIHATVQALQIQRPRCGSAQGEPLTISIGVALVVPAIGRTSQGAVQLADEALYEAKNAGRNRTVVKGAEAYGLLDTGAFKSAQVIPFNSTRP